MFYFTFNRVSPNAVYILEWEDTVMKQNYIEKHGRKAINGAVPEIPRTARMVSSFQMGKRAKNMNHFTNYIHFIYVQANENGLVVVRLYEKRFKTFIKRSSRCIRNINSSKLRLYARSGHKQQKRP